MRRLRVVSRPAARAIVGATIAFFLSTACAAAGGGRPNEGSGVVPNGEQSAATAPGRTGRGPLRVLFIGNSYTYYNDLPSVLTDLVREAREARPLIAEQVLVGGATLESHLGGGEATRRIRAGSSTGPWDLVVLQEQSTRPLDDTTAMYRAVRALASEARAVEARVVLYSTWARAARPLSQDTLSRSYRRVGEELGAIVVPVGDAWAAVRRADSSATRTLFDPDGSHPSPAGTYLAATTFYAALYGRSPAGLPPLSRLTTDQPGPGAPAGAPAAPLAPDLAARLQAAAWRAVQNAGSEATRLTSRSRPPQSASR